MPKFFYRQFPTPHLKLELGGFARKPIIYFHTDRPKLNISVKVSFSRRPGRMVALRVLLDNGGWERQPRSFGITGMVRWFEPRTTVSGRQANRFAGVSLTKRTRGGCRSAKT